MPAVRIELRLGYRFQHFSTDADRIIIGKGGRANLRVPIAFLADDHLEIDQNGGLLRIRAARPEAQAFVDGEAVTRDWRLIAGEAQVAIPGPAGEMLGVRIELQSDPTQPILAVDDDPDNELGTWATPIVASPEGEVEVAARPAVAVEPVRPRRVFTFERPNRLRNWLLLGILGTALSVGGAMGWNEYQRQVADRQTRAQVATYQNLIDQARAQMAEGKYAPARTAILEAQSLAAARGWTEQIAEAKTLLDRPEIAYGAMGYVRVDGKWVEPAVASAWQETKQKLDPKINASVAEARQAMAKNNATDAKRACAEAEALMDAFPAAAKPHPLLNEVHAIQKQADNALVAKEMLAKGMVLYQQRWMTPDEKFRVQQAEKGLVERRGKWITQEEAFAADQQAKGLVLFQGKWMTPEQKLAAQGFVEFEGKWVAKEERDRIVTQRETQKREADAIAAARHAAADPDSLRKLAYEKSQQFLLRKLGNNATAAFATWGEAGVTVVADADSFAIRAPVRVNGATETKIYVCKLRPTVSGAWECEAVGLLDE